MKQNVNSSNIHDYATKGNGDKSISNNKDNLEKKQACKKDKSQKRILKIITEVCRIVLSSTFLFSGFAKANDPLGTMYKLGDYAAAMLHTSLPDTFLLSCGILLAASEFMIGIYLLFAIKRDVTARITVAFMGIMTLFTTYIFIANPVADCGCFGDVIVLSNGATLAKNIILLSAAFILAKHYRLQSQIVNSSMKWLIALLSMCAIIGYAVYCTICLPVFDFRPFKVGTDIQKGINTAEQEYEVKIVYKRGNETLELSAEDDDPDKSWKYVETRRIPVGGKRASVDISILDNDGNDVTEDIVSTPGINFLLIIPNLRNADEGCVNRVNDLYDYALKNKYGFYCLTASTDKKDQTYWDEHTGAEYGYFFCDDRVLKTVVRAQPGLVMLKDGIIVAKWSNFNLPDEEDLLLHM